MIDPRNVCLFIPGGLKKFKLDLFNRIGTKVKAAGGRTVLGHYEQLDKLPDHIIPIVGCTPELRPFINKWIARDRTFIYWDRGYARRVFATWLPRGENGGYYRWHISGFQLCSMRALPDDRWRTLLPGNKVDPRPTEVGEWQRDGEHIVVAEPTATYSRFHQIDGWTKNTLARLAQLTKRKIILRDKESKRPLQEDLAGAHCLIAHGSVAAVEAVILGCPVFVDKTSAAALVGLTDLTKVEEPIYPDRQQWLNNLAYSQFNEKELVDGTLWKLIT